MSNDPVPSDTFGNTISIKDGNGNIITNPNNIGIINPYRYRSYKYDYESGLYYLNSRYYVPEWGRFLNADDVLMESGSIIGNNLYVYCMNNPINLSDPNGNSAISAFLKTVENVVKKAATAVKKSLPDYTEELNAVLISNLYEMFSDRKMFGGILWWLIFMIVFTQEERGIIKLKLDGKILYQYLILGLQHHLYTMEG